MGIGPWPNQCRAWIPLPILSARAADVGFVDITHPEKVPIIESYQGHVVKSLYTIGLEFALISRLRLSPGIMFSSIPPEYRWIRRAR